MQNIDPVVLLEPVLFIALGGGLVVFWNRRRRLVGIVLFLSLIAYAGAIALKEVVQAYTLSTVSTDFGPTSWQLGIYYGLQTSFFEVGLAYLLARYAVSRRLMGPSDAEGYGVSLAFWENAVLLGGLTLIDLSVDYLLINYGLLPQSLYQTLVDSNPGLFYSPQQLAFPIALGVLERFSSFLAHFAWGYLCVFGAWFRRTKYFAIALPMGLLDALVPFAPELPDWEFESIIFALSLGFALLAWRVTKADRLGMAQSAETEPTSGGGVDGAASRRQ